MFYRFLIISILFTLTVGSDIEFEPNPVAVPQLATFNGVRYGSALVGVSLKNSDSFQILQEGFVCPGTNSTQCRTLPPCPCDFTLPCPSLPSCCHAHPAYLPACTNPSNVPAFTTVAPSEPHTLRLSGQPAYLRYHPAPSSGCRGVGLTLRPPWEDPIAELNPVLHTYAIYASFTTPEAHLDEDAIAYRLDSLYGAETYTKTKLCPNPFAETVADVSPSFLGPSNARTLFLSILSTTLSGSDDIAEVSAVFSLYESSDVSEIEIVSFPAEWSYLKDRQSAFSYLSESTALPLIYKHESDVCSDVVFATKALTTGDVDLIMGNYSSLTAPPSLFQMLWHSYQTGDDSIALRLCPGEEIAIQAYMYFGPSYFFVTVVNQAPVQTLDFATDIHPLIAAAYMTNAASLVCNETLIPQSATFSTPSPSSPTHSSPTLPSSFMPVSAASFFCVSWPTADDNDCLQFFPIGFTPVSSILWPPPPTILLSRHPLMTINWREMMQQYPLAFDPSRLYFGVTLKTEYLRDPEAPERTFLDWSQLGGCRIDFLSRIVQGDSGRLIGSSEGLVFSDSAPCDVENITGSMAVIHQFTKEISSYEFRFAGIDEKIAKLFQLALIVLHSNISTCSYMIDEYFLEEKLLMYDHHQDDITDLTNCSSTDPCCIFSSPMVRYFYQYCNHSTQAEGYLQTQVRTESIDQTCPGDSCLEALLEEVSQSESFLLFPNLSEESCAFGMETLVTITSSPITYYRDAKALYFGQFDQGLPCQTDADCPNHPQMRCKPHVYAEMETVPYRASQRLLTKTCQAPSEVFDRLLFDYLIAEMPYFLRQILLLRFGITDPQQIPEVLYPLVFLPGCASLDPTPPVTLTPVIALQSRFGSYCSTRGYCALPVSCLDPYCSQSYTCQYPWAMCPNTWGMVSTVAEAQCNSQFRCNVLQEAELCTGVGDLLTCQSRCQQAFGSHFCGFCPSQDACYIATDSSGAHLDQSECTVFSSTPPSSPSPPACFYQDLGLLTAQPCDDLGVCNLAANPGGSHGPMAAPDCFATRGICLTAQDKKFAFEQGGCLAGLQPQYPSCELGRATPSGCLLVDLDGLPLPGYQTQQECESHFYTLYDPNRAYVWIDPIATKEACMDDERLYVCQFPPENTQPFSDLPTLNSRSSCLTRGGTFVSPYLWVEPYFTPGLPVALSWIATGAVSPAQWTPTRFSHIAFSQLISAIVTDAEAQMDIQIASCTYTNAFSVALVGAACTCEALSPATSPETRTQVCGEYHDETTELLPEPAFLGTSLICDNNHLNDSRVYPSAFQLPPVSVSLQGTVAPGRSALLPGCLSLSGYLYTNSRFLLSRTRIQQSTFYISRPDVKLPALATISSRSFFNGYMLSDGVRLEDNAPNIAKNLTVCITPRWDFLHHVSNVSNTSSHFPFHHLRFGLLQGWNIRIVVSPSELITVSYLEPDGRITLARGSLLTRPLVEVVQVCRTFDTPLDLYKSTDIYVVVLGFDADNEGNGFSTVETVWIYITAVVYLLPVLLIALPATVYSLQRSRLRMAPLYTSACLMCLFLIFRAALLFSIAAGTTLPNSTTEFALTDIAVWCEFSAVALIFIALTGIIHNNAQFTPSDFSKSKTLILLFCSLSLMLLLVFVAFVIAYALTDNSAEGYSQPKTLCAGRIATGQQYWTTRRIIRFTYEILLIIFSVFLGAWLTLIFHGLFASNISASSLHRKIATATLLLSYCMIAHAVIALIFLLSELVNFIFGIIMLWVTEIVPVSIFILICLWRPLYKLYSSTTSNSSPEVSSRQHPMRVSI